MKVIKDATIKVYDCSYCKSTLKLSHNDIIEGHTNYGGDKWIEYYFICPCCKRNNYIELKQ